MAVNVEWVGHACFRVWRDGGPTIVMDPYDLATLEKFGLPKGSPQLEGDIVIVSSLTDKAHGEPARVRGTPRVVNALDVALRRSEAEIDGSRLIAVPAAEAPHHPDGPQDNALYALQVGGLWVMHMGDLGYGLSAEELAPFRDHCDVLLALVGGGLTIPLADLDFVIDYLKPKWIVPMHYELPPLRAKMLPVGDFLARHAQHPLVYPRRSAVKFPLETPGMGSPVILVLEPSGYRAEPQSQLETVSAAGA
ncbi:MAG: MBL fold metallo-hydrolase [Acidimicrobiia bacterium]|nr:MBL fold metallo-hydrolase [Acidimicrobiia bacterium]